MPYWIAILIVALLAGAHTPSVVHAAQPIAVEKFTRLASARDVQISPDGRYLSMVLRSEGKDALVILDATTRKMINGFPVAKASDRVGEVNWVSPERLVYSYTRSSAFVKTPTDHGDLYGVNVDGSRHDIIYGYNANERQTGSHIPKRKASRGWHEVIDVLEDDPKNILITEIPWSEAISQVYKLNVLSGKKRHVVGLPGHDSTAIVDTNGDVRFAITIAKDSYQYTSYRDADADEWSDFTFGDMNPTDIYPHSFTADNQHAYISASSDGGTRALYLVNLQDLTFEKLFHHPKVNIDGFVENFTEDKIVAVSTELGMPEYHYLGSDERLTTIHRSLKKAFAGKDIVISSATWSGDRFIVKTYSDASPDSFYLFEAASMKAAYLVSEHDWVDPELMATTEAMTFETRDGTSIHGYLTRLPDSGNNLPLVVMPHGGPYGVRDVWGYDWEQQLLASHGYAVLTVNFRGSDGFGYGFEHAGYRKWGTLIQDDITDATRTLVENKLADPKRICIYGASFGGYSALMGVAREPDLYQCAIGALGVYDLPSLVSKSDIADNRSGRNYLSKVLGDDKEEQKRQSPVYNADKIKANILLIHGARDERAPIEQAKMLMSSLDRADKKYEWLKLHDEAHSYFDEDNRNKMYSTILKFLDENIGN